MTGQAPAHATTVASRDRGAWRAVMLTGPSGVGKSDLGLRLIARGWRLVSDDYTTLWACEGRLYATAPERIAGKMEARGLGIVDAAMRPMAEVVLAFDCVAETVERLPEPRSRRFAGVDLPLFTLDPRPASAVEIVAAAMQTL